MSILEEKILTSFKAKAKKEVEGLDLFAAIEEDHFPDEEDGRYYALVMEHQDNGKVWQVICTRSGNVKDYFEVE